MNEEAGFLAAIQQTPADDTTRLVYADWLDEQGDAVSRAKAQFLRLTARSSDENLTRREERKLQKLAAKLDPDWLAVVGRLAVENCHSRLSNPVQGFLEFVCDERWDKLTPTIEDGVRMCNRCNESVHYCDTIVTAREHVRQGRCVALDLGIIRHHSDVYEPIDPLELARGMIVDERVEPPVDPVSQAREEAKRKKQEGNG